MARLRLLVLVALLALMATGCEVELAAGIEVGRDGKGQVTAAVGLDAEALAELGDPGAALRVDDLRQAGWRVAEPRQEADGLTWIRASRPFADPEEAMATMAQLTGPAGPFRDFRLTRTRSLLRGKTTFTGVLDLTGGLSGLSDPDLEERLGDVDLGLDIAGLQQRFGADLASSMKVEVTAGLPGKVTTNAPLRQGSRALWSPELGQTLTMEASSEALKIAPSVIAAAAAALLLPVVVVGLARRRADRR